MPVAFAYGIRGPLRRIRARLELMLEAARVAGQVADAEAIARVLSYLDDITLGVPPLMARPALDVAQEELATVGLTLNMGKTNLYTKSGACPPRCSEWHRRLAGEANGFVAVGVPLTDGSAGNVFTTADDQDERTCAGEAAVGDAGVEVPVGNDAFIVAFLRRYVDQRVQPMLDRIASMPELAAEHLPVVQVANLLLRWCVASKCVHLLRLLPPRLTDEFAADVDRRVERTFAQLNRIEDCFDATARHLYQTPLAWGGLGMRPLHAVRESAFVGAWMQCMSFVREHHGDRIPAFAE
eukprot:gene9391-6073_t